MLKLIDISKVVRNVYWLTAVVDSHWRSQTCQVQLDNVSLVT